MTKSLRKLEELVSKQASKKRILNQLDEAIAEVESAEELFPLFVLGTSIPKLSYDFYSRLSSHPLWFITNDFLLWDTNGDEELGETKWVAVQGKTSLRFGKSPGATVWRNANSVYRVLLEHNEGDFSIPELKLLLLSIGSSGQEISEEVLDGTWEALARLPELFETKLTESEREGLHDVVAYQAKQQTSVTDKAITLYEPVTDTTFIVFGTYRHIQVSDLEEIAAKVKSKNLSFVSLEFFNIKKELSKYLDSPLRIARNGGPTEPLRRRITPWFEEANISVEPPVKNIVPLLPRMSKLGGKPYFLLAEENSTVLWPHYSFEGEDYPLRYVAQINISDKMVYVFYELEDENLPIESWDFTDGSNAILIEGGAIPEWIVMKPILKEQMLTWSEAEFELSPFDGKSKFINEESLPEEKRMRNLLYQIDSTDFEVEEMTFGDNGIISIYWNKRDKAIMTVDMC